MKMAEQANGLLLSTMQKFVNHQGKRVAYNVSGDGKPLVLLHGFGFDSGIWETMLPRLGTDYKIITPDMPGAGQSDVLDGEPSIEGLADAVAAVIEEECKEPCAVVGHSMGGYVALALVETHAELVRAFGLFHSHPFADDEARKSKRDKDYEFIQRHGSSEYIKAAIPGLFGEPFKSQHPEIVKSLTERNQSLSADGLVYALQAMKNRPDRSNIVSSSTRPFLLISGVEDPVVTMEMTAAIYKMPQYTFGLFIREAAHMGMVESPEFCAKHLLGWMEIASSR